MTMQEFQPPFVSLTQRDDALSRQGFVLLDASQVRQWLAVDANTLDSLHPFWDALPSDAYLKDGGRYRSRRHSCFVVDGQRVDAVEHRAHWQPLEYNALHGGMQRWFEPIDPDMVSQPEWTAMLAELGMVASTLRGRRSWFVEAHVFRIDTTDGIGRPTPEGAHRDGVDMVAVFMVGRHRIKGGESRVFEANGPNGQRFTLREPWSLLLLDDARVIHESTPIQPLAEGEMGWRDTLVLTFRRDGFQGD